MEESLSRGIQSDARDSGRCILQIAKCRLKLEVETREWRTNRRKVELDLFLAISGLLLATVSGIPITAISGVHYDACTSYRRIIVLAQ